MAVTATPDMTEQARLREALVAAVLARLAVLAQRYAEDDLSTAGWEAAVRTQLLNAHLTAAALAQGGWANLDADTLGLVADRVGTQFEYLANFAAAVPAEDFGAGALARLAQYGNAAVRGTFSAVVRAAAGADAEERNILGGGSQSCEECPALEQDGWVPIGTLPEIGERACFGNCNCTIETRNAAEAAADQDGEA